MSFKKFGWGENSNTIAQTRKIARQCYEDNIDQFVEFNLTTDQKRLMGFEVARKLYGKDIAHSKQFYQDCVSFGCKHAVQYLQVFEIAIKNDNEKYKPLFAPYFYGTGRRTWGFRSKGAGSYGSAMAAAVKKYGSIQEDVQGLPAYSQNVAYDWSGPDRDGSWDFDKWTQIGSKYLVQQTAQIRTWDEAVSSICNGYFMTICSDYGFHMTPNSKGFHEVNPRDPWPHCMAVIGIDNEYSQPYVIIGNSWGCYDKETEVLTNNGWKLFKDVNDNDTICTLNPSNWDIEYHYYNKKFEYDYSGYLNYISGRDTDLMITDNHNVYSCKYNSDKYNIHNWQLSECQDLLKNFHIKKDGNWIGEEIEYYEFDNHKIKMDDWLEFLGYFLSEGYSSISKRVSINKHGNSYKNGFGRRIGITQKKLENIPVITELMDRLPFKYKYFNRTGCFTISNHKSLFNELKIFGKCQDKFIPDYVKKLSKRQLRILFDALMLGDGSYAMSPTGERATYYTSSKQLADDFQELCLKIGYCGDITITDRVGQINNQGRRRNLLEYKVGIKRKQLMQHVEKTGLVLPYNDKIYCLEVPNHIIYVRRNGKACWCGNSVHGTLTDFKTGEQLPPGCLRVRAETFVGMMRDECFTHAGYDGFKVRTLTPDMFAQG